MSAPENIFKTSAIASGLVTPAQMEYVQRLARHRLTAQGNSTGEIVPERLLADLLVEQSVITRYQSDQLCSGRTKISLGPYLITDWIGEGGMGRVYKAVHQVMGRECAVKVLPLHRATPETLLSFAREIRMQAKLDCPYLVRAFDAGQDGNVHYLVTEYIPGMDLRRLVKSRGPLSIQQAAGIVMQAALGLEYAHQKGMIHRDVKPGNILVTPDGLSKVSDVGLAGFAVDLLDDPRAGKIVGTADYLSPEQIRTPLEVGTVSDIYSLGCTLYYATCGKVPFPGGDTTSKIRRHLSETPWHPRKFQPDLTEEFVDIIADMMEKDPSERTQTCAEVAARLEPWAGDAGELTSSRMSRSPWMAPPPSYEPMVELPDEGLLESTGLSLEASQATHRSRDAHPHPSSHTIPPIQADGTVSAMIAEPTSRIPLASSSRMVSTPRPANNTWMIVAMTVALVLPPALVVGAILGFVLKQTISTTR